MFLSSHLGDVERPRYSPELWSPDASASKRRCKVAELLQRSDAARFKIEQLLDLVRRGHIRIPRFQRALRWTATDVERLFDSIYRGFPLGTLLFWQRPAEAQRLEIGPLTIDAPQVSDALWVVDGQQRITSLAAALLSVEIDVADPRFDLSFDLVNEKFIRRRAHEDRETRLPLRAAYDLQQVLAWLRERRLPDVLQDRAFRLADALRNYEVPAYVVTADDDRALREIFDRTNTFGKRMTRAEVFHALHTSAGEQPSDLRALADEVNGTGFGQLDDNTLLFCVLGVRDHDVLRDFHAEFEEDEDLAEVFETARLAIVRTIAFLREDAAVPHFDVVPYQHLTVGLTRFFALHPEPTDWDRVLLRRWFWRSAVHGPIARLGSTGTLRATTKAIVPGEPHASVAGLVELASSERRVPELVAYRWNVADVRATIAALANLRPIDVGTGSTISPTEAIELAGRDALAPVVANRVGDLARTAANRCFVLVDQVSGGGSGEDLATAISVSSDQVLRSHAIPRVAAQSLADGEPEAFVGARATVLREVVAAFVDARAEWEREHRPALQDLRLLDVDG